MNITCYNCLKNNFLNTKIDLFHKCKFCNNVLLSELVIHGSEKNLDQFLKDDLLTVINFWAPWCGPCRNFSHIFEEIAKQYVEKIRFIKINIESEQILSKNFNIKKVPTIFLYEKEKRKSEFLSDLSKLSFSNWLDNFLI